MELGLFIALTALGSIGLVRQSYMLLALSIASFFILAVYVAAQDVTFGQRSEAQQAVYDGNNTLLKTGTASKDDTATIFKENRDVVSWIFYALGAFATLIFFRRLLAMVTNK